MKINTVLLSLVLTSLLSFPAFGEDGAAIFKLRCSACHAFGKGVVIGPDLKDAHKRHDEKWLQQWIRSSQKLVLGNDPAALELFNKFNKIPMPDQDINDADLNTLITYIKQASEAPVAASPVPAANNTSGETLAANPVNSFLIISFLGLGILFFSIIFAFSNTINKLCSKLEENYKKLNRAY